MSRTPWVLAIAIALASCDRSAQDAPVTPLKIGAILPIAGSSIPAARINLRSVGEVARMGLILAEEDAGLNAAMLGWSPEVVFANAPGPDPAARAARRLIATEGVTVLVGGYSPEEAEALSRVAEEGDPPRRVRAAAA